VVHIQRGRRSGQLNGDITHHRVGARQLEIDWWVSAGRSGHGRLGRRVGREAKEVTRLKEGEGGSRRSKRMSLVDSGVDAEVKSGVRNRFRNPLAMDQISDARPRPKLASSGPNPPSQ
jgi:hypothetical protein